MVRLRRFRFPNYDDVFGDGFEVLPPQMRNLGTARASASVFAYAIKQLWPGMTASCRVVISQQTHNRVTVVRLRQPGLQ